MQSSGLAGMAAMCVKAGSTARRPGHGAWVVALALALAPLGGRAWAQDALAEPTPPPPAVATTAAATPAAS